MSVEVLVEQTELLLAELGEEAVAGQLVDVRFGISNPRSVRKRLRVSPVAYAP